jgi:hypothetical protein
MATATGPTDQGVGDAPTHEAVAVFVGATPARTAALRLRRAGVSPDQMMALGRNGPIGLRPGCRLGAGRTGKIVGAVAVGVLCLASGLLLVALAGRTPGDTLAVVVVLLLMADAGALVVGFRGAGRPGRRAASGVEAASPPDCILLTVRTPTAEQTQEARTILRQYGGTAVSVCQVDPATDRAVRASVG